MTGMVVPILTMLSFATDTSGTLVERIDLFNASSGAFTGSEQTFYAPDGRRLRQVFTKADGEPSLLFFVLHDTTGRESQAVFFEDGSDAFTREVFSYQDGGRLKVTTYYYDPDVASDRTEADLDEEGREVRKRYYRGDGTQYGEEEVLWNEDGTKMGWDFRYTERQGGASFRYRYESEDDRGLWTRRTRLRDGIPERLEVRTLTMSATRRPMLSTAVFAPDRVSTGLSEASPSFTSDGRTIVFARYDSDWKRKDAYIGHLEKDGWRVEAMSELGTVYNLAISPDGSAIVYAKASGGPLFRTRRQTDGWSPPEDLTALYGFSGGYPCITDAGDLLFYQSKGSAGDGIYIAVRDGDGFRQAAPFYTPGAGTTFDGFAKSLGGRLLVTRCFDDVCASNSENGVWSITRGAAEGPSARKIAELPYVWGVQPVEDLGLLVFTDGEDILAVPLNAVQYEK